MTIYTVRGYTEKSTSLNIHKLIQQGIYLLEYICYDISL